MFNEEYGEAAVEVLDILNYTNQEDVKKIPQSFINFLSEIASKTYKPVLKYEKTIEEMNIRKEAKELLGFIYITWLCSNEERESYKKIIQNNKIQIKDNNQIDKSVEKTSNSDDIFKNRKTQNSEPEVVNNQANNDEKVEPVGGLMEYEKDGIIRRLFKRILTILHIYKK